jgi:hypothetical protein
MSHPLQLVWDALYARDCQPHGAPHDFRARCPAHGGGNPDALHVFVGADGSVRFWCFASECEYEDITRAIGMDARDLFPTGHHRARRRRLPDGRRADFAGHARTAANVLAGLEMIGADWYLELRCDCPYCGSAAALLQASPRFARLSCPGDSHAEELGYTACTVEQFTQALAGRVEDQRRIETEGRAA